MATTTKTVYVKTANWQVLFDALKLRVFASGTDEFYNLLNQSTIDKHGRIKNDFVGNQLEALHNNNEAEYQRLEKLRKVLVKEARQFGCTVIAGDLCSLHLRKAA